MQGEYFLSFKSIRLSTSSKIFIEFQATLKATVITHRYPTTCVPVLSTTSRKEFEPQNVKNHCGYRNKPIQILESSMLYLQYETITFITVSPV